MNQAVQEIQENNTLKAVKQKDVIFDLCNNRKDKLLPYLNNNSVKFEKLARSFAFQINTNDKLKACNQLSIVQAFYKCCEYGLDPASTLGQVWMIPYGNKLEFQIGYRGWLKLLFNNPMVSNVYSYAVYEGDEFEYELGMNPTVRHVPKNNTKKDEELIATYGIVKFKNGEAQIKVCMRDEIDESKKSSKGAHKSDSPWRHHFEAMALIVPIRRMGRNLGLPLRMEEYEEKQVDMTPIEEYNDAEIKEINDE